MAVREYDRLRRSADDDRDRAREAIKAIAGRRLLLHGLLLLILASWRAVKKTTHMACYGLLSNPTGRMALALSALYLLLLSGLSGEAILAGAGVWTIILIAGAAAYGARAWRSRRQLEESIKDTVREVVPGHSGAYPPEVTFGPRLRWPNLYRYTGSYDFNFRVPNVVRRSHLFDLEEHLAERLRANDDATWATKWNLKMGQARVTCISEIPGLIAYQELDYALETFPGGDRVAPDRIPIAVSREGIEFWDPEEVPHALFAGTTGSGKSTAEQTVLAHTLRHPERWEIYAIDPKRVELAALRRYSNVRQVATDVEDMAEVIKAAWAEMERRYKEMEEAGNRSGKYYTKYLEFNPDARRILVVVDELADITAVSGLKNEEAKVEDELAGRMTLDLERIAAKGRAAGVHLLLCTQRPDVADGVMSGKMRNNIGGRLACGSMDGSSSRMILRDSDAAAELEDDAKGRGIWLPDKRERKVQIVFTGTDDLPEIKEIAA